MQIAVILLGSLLFLCAAGFGGYLWYEDTQYQKALQKYPVAYTELIKQYADQYELDPYLVQSIMRCESSNNPNAVSKVGAIGLMQIMPNTGEWIGHKIDPELAYSLDLLQDPATSIEYGCWYLNYLSNRFDGNVMEIIAAYNAGHGNVEKWLDDPRFSQNGTLTTIPFEDTARYYDNVMQAYENYTTLYPDLFTTKTQSATVVAG
ncbi:MAG: lytic transglycosylase domain-containing protein [Eubacteriales bacterium]|nr:lytic transglycosylase domain-containing protein [Eubacteriales bacterium]